MEQKTSNLFKQFIAAGYLNTLELSGNFWSCQELPSWSCDLTSSFIQSFTDPQTGNKLCVIETYDGIKGIWVSKKSKITKNQIL